MRPIPDILRAAGTIIDSPEKWGQGPCLPEGRYCLGLAVSMVLGDEENDEYWRTHDILCVATGSDAFDAVSSWNDAPGRTHEEVMGLIEKAVELAEARWPATT